MFERDFELEQRGLSGADDYAAEGTGVMSKQQQLYNSLTFNAIIFAILILLFEANRHIKLIYLKRVSAKFIREKRVPPIPPRYPFGWIIEIMKISDDNLLAMVGLDGYMLLRYITVCLRCCVFMAFWGLCCLAPIYSIHGEVQSGWTQYTLANLSLHPEDITYWAPAVFMYLFSIYFCYSMYSEYKRFVKKRVEYLINGDPDTPPQTYYTLMLEKIPSSLRSETHLYQFFDNIFPGEIYSVEVALDLNELDELVQRRRDSRTGLEKAVAISNATGTPPTTWVPKTETAILNELKIKHPSTVADFLGYVVVDSIEYHTLLLNTLNVSVSEMQEAFANQRMQLDSESNQNIRHSNFEHAEDRGRLERTAMGAIGSLRTQLQTKLPFPNRKAKTSREEQQSTGGIHSADEESEPPPPPDSLHSNDKSASSLRLGLTNAGAKIVNVASTGVEELAKEGFKTARMATKGALRGVLEATRALELLTLGAYYKTSTTAFVTLNSRVANSSAHQMLLSHKYFTMEIHPAPNPKDIIWENVSIPKKQLNLRHTIADSTLIIGALFWSGVVTFITVIGNLNMLAQQFPALQNYSTTTFYQILNSYLVSGLLLILLSILPIIFDFIARNYEGMKVESEIQSSIMTRYFYYQLANVFVSVGLGSLATSIHQIIDQPSSILPILGNSLPNLSFYFTTLVITKTFTALPLELLRVGPLFQILSVMLCMDRKKCTKRELSTGAFADPPMLYGWCYPNIMMVLMIMLTYACIAPMILPFCLIFFAFTLLMYKYQLLYVYVTDYQSGGYMWYAVFSRSMVCLIWAVVTLICYLAIRETFYTGPFYLLLPLPVAITIFWYQCDDMFKNPSLKLSLESAIELDKAAEARHAEGKKTAHNTFRVTRFRQPSLAEKPLSPMPYRSPNRESVGSSSAFEHPLSRSNSLDQLEDGDGRPASPGDALAITTTNARASLQNRLLTLPKDSSYVDYYVDNYDTITELENEHAEENFAEAAEILENSPIEITTRRSTFVTSPLTPSLNKADTSDNLGSPINHNEQNPIIIEQMNHASYGATASTPTSPTQAEPRKSWGIEDVKDSKK